MTAKISSAEELAAHIDRMAADSVAIGRNCAEVHYLEGGLPPDAGQLEDLKQGFRIGSDLLIDSRLVCGKGEQWPGDFRRAILEFLTLSAVEAFLRRINQIARGEALHALVSCQGRVPS